MKSSLLLVPTILAASVAIADAQSHAVDAQAQAAGLLVRPHTSPVSKTDGRGRSLPPASRALDAQASAAMLLSGVRPSQPSAASQVDLVTHAREQGDAQAQAAALLSGVRISTNAQLGPRPPRDSTLTSERKTSGETIRP
jgi:hypothetical protein